jgi:Cu/Ag efflux pump CusA
VILGGLLSSTFLNLVVVPAGYAALHGVSARNPNPQTKPTTNTNA